MSTTFHTATDLVFSPSRTPDMLRSSDRNVSFPGVKIANRSNYTRVQFDHESAAAFILPVSHYTARISAQRFAGAVMVIRDLEGGRAHLALGPDEMRAMAYGLLAAANWIDSRDNAEGQKARAPRLPKV